jgi:uncharacterized protein
MKSFFVNFLRIVFIVLTINAIARCSPNDDLKFILRCNPIVGTINRDNSPDSLKYRSEAKLVLTGAIRFYQKFISSQDMNVCNFSPSCSHFANESLNKYGVFYGLLMASDRLQRCNGTSAGYYPKKSESGKLIDPIEKYYLGHK